MKAVQRVANIGGFVGCLLGGDEGKGRELAALWAGCIEGTSRRLGSWDSLAVVSLGWLIGCFGGCVVG